MSEQIERLLVRVEANTAQAERQMRQFNRALYGSSAQTRKAMDRIQQDVDRASRGVRKSVLMTTTALSALGVGFGAAQLVRDFREAEESSRRLEAVLKTTGHAAGLSSTQIEAWARDLEIATGRSATEIQNAAAQLATFTSVGRNEFLSAIEVANDMAAVFGGDLKSNLDAVARALDDPVEGFANLRKRGFALTEAELKRAEAHIKAGRSAEAQQVVLRNLSAQVSGTAAAVNTGLTKSLNDLRRQAGDTFKAFADQRGTDAAIAALELASKGVVFLGDNMDGLLAAGETLAVFMVSRYATGMGIATVATLANAAASLKAKDAANALSAAMARNPAGLAALGVAALVSGLYLLNREFGESATVQREVGRITGQLTTATEAYEKAALAAATATGEAKVAALEEVAALRVLQVEARKAAEDKLKLAKASLAQAQAQLAANVAAMNDPTNAEWRTQSGLGHVQNSLRGRQATLAATTEEAAAAIAAADEIINRIDRGLSQNTTQIEHDDKGDKNAAKKAEQRRRAIEDMKAEVDLQEAQLLNDQDRIRALEREAAVRTRTRALIDAEILKDAAAAAEAERVQARLDAALEQQTRRQFEALQKAHGLELDRIDENHVLVRVLERQAELQERIESYQAAGLDLVAATGVATADLLELDRARADAASRRLNDAHEEHRLTVATLSGNDRLARLLQDQQEIRERTRTYQGDDYRLNEADARTRATDEVTRERLAATRGEHREMFASAFSEGIRAAMDGDVKSFLANQFGGFADTMLQRAGEQIYDAVFGTVDAVAEGAAQGAAQGAAMGAAATPAIAAAGVTAGASMAAQIVAAGTAAGTAMALAISGASAGASVASGIRNIGMFMPGFDSGGYTGPGGKKQPAGVVHKGEVVWSQEDIARAGGVRVVEAMRKGLMGYTQGGAVGLMPAAHRASAKVQSVAHMGGGQPIYFDLSNAVVTEDLLAQMNQIGAQAQAGAVTQVAAAANKQNLRSAYKTRRGRG